MMMIKMIPIFILLLCSTSHAQPYLGCDPQAGVTKYLVGLNGVQYESPAVETALRFDLAGKWKSGDNEAVVRAVNAWGVSDSASISFYCRRYTALGYVTFGFYDITGKRIVARVPIGAGE